MILNTDYGGQLITLFATIAISFWQELHHLGIVIVVLSGLLGLILGISRMIDFINSRYEGNVTRYVKEGFKLKKPKKRK